MKDVLVLGGMLRDGLLAKYAFHEWAVDRSPPPEVRGIWIVALHLALIGATFAAFPHKNWGLLALLAAMLPAMVLASFYGLRSWSRPRPVDDARELHHAQQAQLRDLRDSGLETFRNHVPMSFSTALQMSVVVPFAGLYAVVGNYVFVVMMQLDAPGTAIVGIVVWGGIVLLALFAFLVGGLGWPRWPMPYVLRHAGEEGGLVLNAEDYRAE